MEKGQGHDRASEGGEWWLIYFVHSYWMTLFCVYVLHQQERNINTCIQFWY